MLILFCIELGSCGFMFFVYNQTSLSDSFLLCLQLLLLDVVHPIWWFADIILDSIVLYTPQRLAILVRDEPVRRAPTIYPLLNSDMSPIMFCGFVQLCYCSANSI